MSDDPDTSIPTSTTTTSASAAGSGSLRRSKRNKFHLDVAAIHHGRSRSPAHFTVLQPLQPQQQQQSQPGPSTIIKASPRDSPIICTLQKQSEEIIIAAVEEPLIARTSTPNNNGSKKIQIKKSSAVTQNIISREETATPESLGKRKRKAAVFDDFSYSIDSEDDAESHIIINNNSSRVEMEYTNHTPSDLNSSTPTGIKSENEYPCPRCPAQFETRVGLTNHLKLHGANKTFPCHSCDFSCTNRKTMRQHKRVHGQSAPAKKRKSVDVKKPSPFNVDNILGNDGKKPKRTFPCPWCCYKTHTFARLIPHKLGHFKTHGYQCPNCTFR